MAQTTVDYTSVKSAGAWTNLSYVAADDSDKAQAAPDNVTGQIEVGDAPGDYNGSSINTVKFSVVDWDITAAASRAKFIVVSWRKADTTVIHQYTTPDKSSTGEQTDTDAGFVTPSGTTSLTSTEWDNSYIEIVADEGGGKGDAVEILLDYVKVEVDYDTGSQTLSRDVQDSNTLTDSPGRNYWGDRARSDSFVLGDNPLHSYWGGRLWLDMFGFADNLTTSMTPANAPVIKRRRHVVIKLKTH